MIITFTPVRPMRCQFNATRQGCAMGSRPFCSPTVLIVNHVGRPPESNDARSSEGSSSSQTFGEEVDPIATQIPDEAQRLLDEALSEIEPKGSDIDE